MPELPEVEVTRLGISRHLVGTTVTGVAVRNAKLAASLPGDLAAQLAGQEIRSIERRGKYLLIGCPNGTVLLHLGMTGHLRLVPLDRRPGKHDLFDLSFSSGLMLRLNDTRHFGSLHWTTQEPQAHRLLAHLGPEPLTGDFSGAYLYRKTRGRKVAVQRLIMDGCVVAGVGNIYAAESLFRCGIVPTRLAGSLTEKECAELAEAIKTVLAGSIATGTAGMDFLREEEKLAYFAQELTVYRREGKPCRVCGNSIVRGRLGNRSIFYCPHCQH